MPRLRVTRGDITVIKTRRNVITCYQILFYMENCARPSYLFARGKQGEFCYLGNCQPIKWKLRRKLPRRSWWENIRPKNSLRFYVGGVRWGIYFIPVDITEDVVKSVAQKLSMSSGTGGMYSEALQGCLRKFGEDSKIIRTSVDFFWLASQSASTLGSLQGIYVWPPDCSRHTSWHFSVRHRGNLATSFC